MLILLPPSETKAQGGDGAPLDLDALSFTELNPTRRRLVGALFELAADVPASLATLGLSEAQISEVVRNGKLPTAPTMPALHRYTGVLYDALDAGSFTAAQRGRAQKRLAVASALFGLVAAGDPIPAYRLSGGNSLPGIGTLRPVWRPALEPVLEKVPGPLIDLRSGTYAALAKAPGAITVRVVTEDGAGRRKTVSHHNKAYKGRLASVWARTPREPSTVRGLVSVALRAGLRLEQTGEHALELITH